MTRRPAPAGLLYVSAGSRSCLHEYSAHSRASSRRCGPVVLRNNSSRDGFQQVVMMQAAETRGGDDTMSGW